MNKGDFSAAEIFNGLTNKIFQKTSDNNGRVNCSDRF